MFRRGGVANEGIMSGLRQGYAEGDKVDNQQDWNWMDESGLGKVLKFGGNLAMDIPSSVIDTALLAPINQAGKFFLGSNPGLSMNKAQEAIKKSLFGENAEIYDPDNPDVFYHDEDADPNITEFFGYNTSAVPTGIFADDKESTTGAAQADEVKTGPNVEDNKNQIVDSGTGEVPGSDRASDVKAIYEDILPLLQSTMGVDDSELGRQKYLELAKFGASLMAQPGGSLTKAIGKAAEQPLEGLTRIAETQRKGKRAPAEIAMKIALAETEGGTLGKQIKDLKKIYPRQKGESVSSWNKRIGDKVLERGTATRESTTESRITDRADRLIKDGYVLNESHGPSVAGVLEDAADIGVPPTKFKKLKQADLGTAKDGEYYIIYETGEVGRYDKKNKTFIEVGETGFIDK